jgi:polyketide synthase 12/myxalamid-type polyketide synthase MxaF
MNRPDPGRQIILRLLSSHLGLPAGAIDVSERFIHYGVDSIMAARLSVELSAEIGRPLPATALWEHPTVEALSAHLRAPAPNQPGANETLRSPGVEPRAAHAGPTPRAARTGPTPQAAHGGVAIVGLACRFPAAPDARSFWRLLAEGGDAVRDVPPDRWTQGSVPGTDPIHRAGLLDDVAGFDAAFFGLSPREGAEMDPQQRLMLELSWEALVDAGIPAMDLRGSRTGVFTGAMWRDYATLNRGGLDGVSNFTATGEDLSIISGRVSYYFGFEGPSLTVNTACSSSLVAAHLACRSLLWGETNVALAGGVNLILDPRSSVAMSRFGGLSRDGRCKAFDARADGYVRGEGGAVVVLKRLADAIADGDRVYCVIRGSAVNNDGFSNGLTAPNPRQQVAVLREAWANAGIAMARAHYVEAHGTGTALGDPIEANALGEAFGPRRCGSAA